MTYHDSGPAVLSDNPQPLPRTLARAVRYGPLTRERCAELLAAAEQEPHDVPWRQRLGDRMEAGERAHVQRVLVVLNQASWYEAFDLLRRNAPRRI